MADTTQYKSVAVDISTYNKLQKLCEDEHRNPRQQIAKLTADEYSDKYGNMVSNSGIGSAPKS
tara:strand:+ start:490 stop:678 length:189 start_codon:yes stop_codon:yes gene_type:complete